MGAWPSYLLDRAARPPPEGCGVVPGSTPVVSFGHPLRPVVATLGINPSSSEFLDGAKRLLTGERRRLATLESITATGYADIDRERAAAIIDDCATYFRRQPYRWFTDLDQILTTGLGVSYFDETACHLDLVQWATDPLWKDLTGAQRRRLLEADRGFLEEQLADEGYRVVVVAGKTALEWVESAGLVTWEPVHRIDSQPRATFYVKDAPGARFVAWSCNVQSQHGARRHIPTLARLLDRYARKELKGKPISEGDTMLGKGTHFHSRAGLIEALEQWLEQSDQETIGDPSFGRAPWLSFDTSAGIADLNADTRTDAVERMLRHARFHPDDPWHVVENRRGSVNKIVFDWSDSHEGWYAYLREPLGAPHELE